MTETVLDGLAFPEGPRWRDGRLWFSDQHDHRVVSMLPDGAVKLRLYVPEPQFASIAVGKQLSVHCDGCPDGLVARISYVSSEPEFTPPVIYSLETRQKLVYLVEAKVENDGTLQPGQIVDVNLSE